MGKVMILLWVLAALVVVMLGYVRLAPSDPVAWHKMVATTENRDFANGVVRVVQTGPDGIERFDALALATARTVRLFGAVDDGMATYVTRSAMVGFPDYTTVKQEGDTLRIHARARFGRSDFGVNRDRVQKWIDALQPG